MATLKKKPRSKARKPIPTRPVKEVLLDLAYLMHATRTVAILPKGAGSVA